MSDEPLERDLDAILALSDHDLFDWRERAQAEMDRNPEDHELHKLYQRTTFEIDQRTAGQQPDVSRWQT